MGQSESEDFYNKLFILRDMFFRPINAIRTIIDLLKKDPTAWLLLFSNIFVLLIAVIENLSINELIFAYACQVFISGIFQSLRIILFNVSGPKKSEMESQLNDKYKERIKGLLMPKQPIMFDLKLKIGWGISFLIFFIIYCTLIGFPTYFLLTGEIINYLNTNFGEKLPTVLLTILIFTINHAFSFVFNYKKDQKKVWNFGELLIVPFLRGLPVFLLMFAWILIIPFSIIFNPTLATITIFIFFKTTTDLLLHSISH